MSQHLEADVVIVGGGGSGIRAAIEAHDMGANVILVTNKPFGKGGATSSATSDFMAFSAAMGHADPNDNADHHFEDTMAMGAGVSDARLVQIVVNDAPNRLQELLAWGARFKMVSPGKLYQFLTDGSSYPRACGKGPDTSWEIEKVLVKQARARAIKVLDNHLILKLVVQEGRIVGAVGVDVTNLNMVPIICKTIVLCTGGAGQIYKHNVYPPDITGDGYSLAYEAGADLVNMEFIQIIPSIIRPFKFACSGALWRAGPHLLNGKGEEFLENYIPKGYDIATTIRIKGTTAPFSIRNESRFIDIGIYEEVSSGRGTALDGVLMDFSHNTNDVFDNECSVPFNWLLRHRIDIRKEPIEICEAIQHFNGGVKIDINTETTVPNLFCAGECAGSQNGADRPGGNALADSQVLGRLAGQQAAQRSKEIPMPITLDLTEFPFNRRIDSLKSQTKGVRVSICVEELKETMQDCASIVRSETKLKKGLTVVQSLRKTLPELTAQTNSEVVEALQLEKMVTVAEMIIRAALMRRESRGPHYRSDFPNLDDTNWRQYVVIRKIGENMKLFTKIP